MPEPRRVLDDYSEIYEPDLGYAIHFDGSITKPDGSPLTELTPVTPEHWKIATQRARRRR